MRLVPFLVSDSSTRVLQVSDSVGGRGIPGSRNENPAMNLSILARIRYRGVVESPIMIHHILKHTAKGIGKFYAANPHKAVAHGTAAVQIGTMAWTQGHHIAKHTAKFMAKAAVKGFNLFRS